MWNPRKVTPPYEQPIQVVGYDWSPYSTVGMLKVVKGKQRFFSYNKRLGGLERDDNGWTERSSWRLVEDLTHEGEIVTEGLKKAKADLEERLNNKRDPRQVYPKN